MERNEFLQRGFGSLPGIAIIACKRADVDPTTTGTTTGSTNGSSASNCAVTPTETAGPFPTKSPASCVRKDIRDDRTGVPLAMNIFIKNANADCAALAGAFVDVWHCDKDGSTAAAGCRA